jgi:hypothetical protein
MRFTMEKDPTDYPKNGSLASGRSGGKGTKYGPGGPGGSGGDSANAGPNGTTKGPAPARITGFHGSPKVAGTKPWPAARTQSNPNKG